MHATGQLGICAGHAAYDVHDRSIASVVFKRRIHTLQVVKACGT